MFPAFFYHKSLEPKLVKDELEFKDLGKDWMDSPAHFENEMEIVKDGPTEKMKSVKKSDSYKEHMEKWPSKEEKGVSLDEAMTLLPIVEPKKSKKGK